MPDAIGRARAGGIALFVCAALILFGTLTRSWFTFADGDLDGNFGLMGSRFCARFLGTQECHGRWISLDPDPWRLGAFFGGLGAVAMAGLCGVFVRSGEPEKTPLGLLYVVTGVALACGAVWALRTTGEMPGGIRAHLGYSAIVDALGLVGALVVAIVMIRPAVPRGSPAPSLPSLPPGMKPVGCPRCGVQLTFEGRAQRWFCPRCQQHV